MSIDLKFVELTADVLEIFFIKSTIYRCYTAKTKIKAAKKKIMKTMPHFWGPSQYSETKKDEKCYLSLWSRHA